MKMELMRVLQVKLEKPGYEFNFAVESSKAHTQETLIWNAAVSLFYDLRVDSNDFLMLREFIDERPSSFEFRPDIKITVKEVPGVKKIHH